MAFEDVIIVLSYPFNLTSLIYIIVDVCVPLPSIINYFKSLHNSDILYSDIKSISDTLTDLAVDNPASPQWDHSIRHHGLMVHLL